MKNLHITILLSLLTLFLLSSCIEDGVSTSSSDQPVFSVDTLRLTDSFTGATTPTGRFIVHNRHDKIISIGSIALRDKEQEIFRLNVDGISGKEFRNVEIRPNDSIFVFVEAKLPVNGTDNPVVVENILDFNTQGVTRSVVLSVKGQDAVDIHGVTLSANTTWTDAKPYHIFDSLVVAEGVTLNLTPGTRLAFHDKAYMKVYGTVRSEGTPEKPVQLTGDRSGFVASDIPYEIMSGQWEGVFFAPTSKDNLLKFTSIRNYSNGIVLDNVDSSPALTVIASQLRNSKGYVLAALNSDVELYASELAEASEGILYLEGGKHTINHCTIANYYLFSALGGPAVQFYHLDEADDNGSGKPYLAADISNSIIYGNGTELNIGDFTGKPVYFRNTLLRSSGTNDDNFIDCLWDVDPLYYTVRQDYYFNYHLQPESPAIGVANPALTHPNSSVDFSGNKQNMSAPDLGAYVFVPEEE
ncbi:MAG: hypothetical protein K2M07_03060 [Muribaculaceae bacterium]|nr:hypothetical protein [Muribaculaceae bacterium]